MKKIKIVTVMILMLSLFSPQFSHAQTGSMIEAGYSKALGNEVRVPITIQNIQRLSSGHFTIELTGGGNKFSFDRFELSKEFDGELFTTSKRLINNKLIVDFISSNQGRDQQITSEVVGYVVYDINSSATVGDKATVFLTNTVLKDQRGSILSVEAYNGQIEKNMPLGDVVGLDKVSPAAAIKILQHNSGKRLIQGADQIQSADVDADGEITSADAMSILAAVSGKQQGFLSIKTKELGTAILNQDFSVKLEAVYGVGPYTWELDRHGGRLLAGFNLDSKTGMISGKALREGSSPIIVRVTDRSGNTTEKAFTLTAKDSNIQSIEKVNPITVKIGDTVILPSTLNVTYKDGTREEKAVYWETVDTSTADLKVVYGTIIGTDLKVSAEVQIVNEADIHIKNVTTKYLALLNIHTVVVDVSKDVFFAKIVKGSGRTATELPMLYDPPQEEDADYDRFSKGTTLLKQGDVITIIVYDMFENEIDRKTYTLQ